ncbi:MAG: DUF5714 domain-containing protein [Oscillospiraceae bacterium]|nr:DUF5714 domain-containing protein [Oscillospiraceae bacterium]
METAKSRGCLICGAPLRYHKSSRRMRCSLCGTVRETEVACARGHFVCDACHSGGAVSVARELSMRSVSSDPWEIALSIMRVPSVQTHGPEHHSIVGFALAAAYCNAEDKREDLPVLLDIIEKRSNRIPGGVCGYWGACGAAVGAGVFLSAILGATPLRGGKLCNMLTAECLIAIAEVSDIRCCKRNLGIALRETVAFLRERGIAELSQPQIVCEFSARNRECIGSACPWKPSA